MTRSDGRLADNICDRENWAVEAATCDLGECAKCNEHLDAAIATAACTGSLGCTYGDDTHRVTIGRRF